VACLRLAGTDLAEDARRVVRDGARGFVPGGSSAVVADMRAGLWAVRDSSERAPTVVPFAGDARLVSGLGLAVTIRVSARIACLAIVGAEAMAVARRAHDTSALWFWTVFLALQIVGVVWATDRRSSVAVRMVAPAVLTGVTVAAVWTAVALAVPAIAVGDAAALVAILAVGPAMAAVPRRSAGQRLLPLVLIASAGSALLIFLVIIFFLPAIPGFISNNHDPVYTAHVTRLVDPVREFGLFVLLAMALGIDLLRSRIRNRLAAARAQRLGHVAGPNEMVVERAV